MHLTPYLLVGGRSSRMGRDKAFVPWQGTTLLQDAIGRLARFGPARLLSGDAADTVRAAQLSRFGALVPDREAGAGPLGGIDAALHDLASDWALVLPIDQPCLPPHVLYEWVERLVHTDSTAAWFTHPGGAEPLPLLLHRSLAGAIHLALRAGQRRLLPTVAAAAGTHGRPCAVDSSEWFRNLNFPHDLDPATGPPG